jgi:hypothetical protein
MEILATAIIPATSPSDVVLLPRHTMFRSQTQARGTDAGLAIARVNKPALTTWLRDAINHLLVGTPLDQPRPDGLLLEQGAFRAADMQVVATDWYGRGHRLVIARSSDADAAGHLAARLQTLLEHR